MHVTANIYNLKNILKKGFKKLYFRTQYMNCICTDMQIIQVFDFIIFYI